MSNDGHGPIWQAIYFFTVLCAAAVPVIFIGGAILVAFPVILVVGAVIGVIVLIAKICENR